MLLLVRRLHRQSAPLICGIDDENAEVQQRCMIKKERAETLQRLGNEFLPILIINAACLVSHTHTHTHKREFTIYIIHIDPLFAETLRKFLSIQQWNSMQISK